MFHASYSWSGPQLPKGCGCIGLLSPMHKNIPDSYSKREGGQPWEFWSLVSMVVHTNPRLCGRTTMRNRALSFLGTPELQKRGKKAKLHENSMVCLNRNFGWTNRKKGTRLRDRSFVTGRGGYKWESCGPKIVVLPLNTG